jgi:hypothetical protein
MTPPVQGVVLFILNRRIAMMRPALRPLMVSVVTCKAALLAVSVPVPRRLPLLLLKLVALKLVAVRHGQQQRRASAAGVSTSPPAVIGQLKTRRCSGGLMDHLDSHQRP